MGWLKIYYHSIKAIKSEFPKGTSLQWHIEKGMYKEFTSKEDKLKTENEKDFILEKSIRNFKEGVDLENFIRNSLGETYKKTYIKFEFQSDNLGDILCI